MVHLVYDNLIHPLQFATIMNYLQLEYDLVKILWSTNGVAVICQSLAPRRIHYPDSPHI